MSHLNTKVAEICNAMTKEELAIGWMRYEVTRKLNARQFTELCLRNVRGEQFDDMIDQLVSEHWE